MLSRHVADFQNESIWLASSSVLIQPLPGGASGSNRTFAHSTITYMMVSSNRLDSTTLVSSAGKKRLWCRTRTGRNGKPNKLNDTRIPRLFPVPGHPRSTTVPIVLVLPLIFDKRFLVIVSPCPSVPLELELIYVHPSRLTLRIRSPDISQDQDGLIRSAILSHTRTLMVKSIILYRPNNL